MALTLVLVADRCLEGLLFRRWPLLPRGFQAIAAHRRQDAGRLLTAHHADARIRPHPQEARLVAAAAHGVIAGAKTSADQHGELGHVRARHGGHHLRAILRNARVFVFASDHEPGDVLKENQRDIALIAQFYEVRALQRRLGEEDAVVGDDAHRIAVDVGKTADQGLAVACLELMQLRAVDDARDDLAHVVGQPRVGGNDAVDVLRRILRFFRRNNRQVIVFTSIQVANDVARNGQRVGIAFGEMVGDARGAAMDFRAAESLGVHHFPGGRFYQRRAAQEDGALFAHDDGFVAHRRHIGAAGGTRTHDHRDLWNVQRRQPRLVVEDAAEVIAVGKHLVLQGQKGAAGIDQVDAREVVFQRHFLRTQMLLDGDREVGATLHGGIVGHHHHFLSVDATDAGDQAGAGRLAVVHAVGCQRRQFEERRSGIEQGAHALARQQLAACAVLLARLLATAFCSRRLGGLEVLDRGAHMRGIGLELLALGMDTAGDLGHGLGVGGLKG